MLKSISRAWTDIGPTALGLLISVLMISAVVIWLAGIALPKPPKRYEVEAFTTDLTIRIECSGDCDLAAMIAEARQAVEK